MQIKFIATYTCDAISHAASLPLMSRCDLSETVGLRVKSFTSLCRSFSKAPVLSRTTLEVKEHKGARGRLRMYYDLNVPYLAELGELQRTLAFLSERESSWD